MYTSHLPNKHWTMPNLNHTKKPTIDAKMLSITVAQAIKEARLNRIIYDNNKERLTSAIQKTLYKKSALMN